MNSVVRNHEAMTSEELIATMVDRIADQFDPDRIVLFGSWARGDAKASSDVDLLVVMPNGTDRRDAAIAMRGAVGDLPLAKDIVITTPDEITRRAHIVGTVLRVALREGKVVHERA